MLQSRRQFHRLSLMYKIVNNKAPTYLIENIPQLIGDRTNYGLRNRSDLDPVSSRINLYTNSFIPKTVKDWNNLDRVSKASPSIEAFKANHRRKLDQKNPLYFYGGSLEASIHARLRINNSPLKADLCRGLHVIDSPLYPCGSGESEDAKHFFFKCSLYDNQWDDLVNNLLPYSIGERECSKLLFGITEADHCANIHIYSAVQQFIRDTKRFYQIVMHGDPTHSTYNFTM